MEHKSEAAIDIVSAVTTTNKNHQDGIPKITKKKRRSAMHILRVAMYMLSLKSGKSTSVHADAASKWKKYLSFMRPLHVHSNHQRIEATPAPVTSTEVVEESKVTPPPASEDVVEQLEVFTPPMSPAPKSVASSSSGQTSQYTSAQNLLDLLIDMSDDEDEDGDEDSYYDDKYGDETIDMKAEQFIAKFYVQMKLQHKSH
ncbi:COTTON FIBER PROTEIN [Salix purpurea]|uniref:COTTON FIBER PROTEIN n=1 Tax=Salix purpurea TaxID=77065 RepID=A0A9Q0PEC6_SALPP|nr:COTTON FIBER PROTEIN [Salix purpurea]